MKKLHYKKEMMYLNRLSDYLTELGYEVEEPSTKYRYILDVWGKINGKKCFVEIVISLYECDNGINGILDYGDNEGIEMYLSYDPIYGLDTGNSIHCILDGLQPLRKKRN